MPIGTLRESSTIPKNSAREWTGLSVTKLSITPASDSTTAPMPTTIGSSSIQSSALYWANAAVRSFGSFFVASRKRFAWCSTRSYTPVTSAIVPPETPGTSSAKPIKPPRTIFISICSIFIAHHRTARPGQPRLNSRPKVHVCAVHCGRVALCPLCALSFILWDAPTWSF